MSIKIHVNAQIAVASAGSASANFGTPIFVAEHSITSNRQDGPYSSLAAAEAAGFDGFQLILKDGFTII